MDQIQSTSNYKMFKKVEGNRQIISSHLKKLKKAIQEDNQLNLHPIIVNSNFEVIDGQHRLKVAEELQIPIFYIQSDDVQDSHIIESNVNQKTFVVENYIDYYCTKDKKEDYIKMRQIMEATQLNIRALLTMILGTVSISILEFIKKGNFKLPENQDYLKTIELFQNFISYTRDKRITPFSMFSSHKFTRAFRWLASTTGFDSATFFKKLDGKWFELKPQGTSEEWYSLLINIYNFRNQNRIEDEFTKKEF